jgi:CheY-like chemotaxis protein
MATILVIDDAEDLRTILRHLFESAGHEVLDAPNGEEGLRLWKSHSPHLVMTDLMMPGTDGLQVIQEIRRREGNAKIIAMTGSVHRGAGSLLEEAVRLGATRTFEKPFDLKRILEATDELLEVPRPRHRPASPGNDGIV